MVTYKSIERYIKDIKCLIPFFSHDERRFLLDFKESLIDYAEENPNVNYADLIERFGTAADVVRDYTSSFDHDTLAQKTLKKNLFNLMFGIISAAFIGAFVSHYYFLQRLSLLLQQNNSITELIGKELDKMNFIVHILSTPFYFFVLIFALLATYTLLFKKNDDTQDSSSSVTSSSAINLNSDELTVSKQNTENENHIRN